MNRDGATHRGNLRLYADSLALHTDLYEITMAYSYWRSGTYTKEAVFNLYFRRNPFDGGYAVACGLAHIIDYIEGLRFAEDDLDYLAMLRGNDGKRLFVPEFLDYLRNLKFDCDVDAIEEGTLVFANEPTIRVRGPILQAQILETPLLNIFNFQTLIATKAARVVEAAQGDPVIEFGLRRAQGIDGGLSASRAAYVGGCVSTSNLLAGKIFGIPVGGTHAHSWVMSFDREEDAFDAYARAMPNNGVFLVDTYDSIAGVRHAIETGRRLRAQGHEMIGIRLDSGDLAYLSIEARKMLDAAGFQQARIFASSELDEHVITSLKLQGARIDTWGVGTHLATGFDQPALGGIYKLTAVREPGAEWKCKLKLSEQAAKVTNPGTLQVRRYETESGFAGDLIFDEQLGVSEDVIVDPVDATRRKPIPASARRDDLLVPIFRAGKRVYDPPPIRETHERCRRQIDKLHPGVRRFLNPHEYPVGLEARLHDLKLRLVREAREAVRRAREEARSAGEP